MDPSIYRNFPLATLKAMLEGQITSQSSGSGIIAEYTINGVQTVRREGNMTREEFLNAVNWALERLSPAEYKPLIDRARVTF